MHDPCTVAFDIRNPFTGRTVVTIWHVDPENDGSDDSCGWFIRGRHCNKDTLKKIERDFEFQWSHGVPFGWFDHSGNPNYSPHSIVLDMFLIASNHAFGHWSKKTKRFLRDHAFGILHFAENNCDSLWTGITRHYQNRFNEPEDREERIQNMASTIYSWILRESRPWWRHPRWHFWHWSIQIHALQSLRRRLFTRCTECGKRFKGGDSVVGYGWGSPPRRWFEWFRSEQGLKHMDCAGCRVAQTVQ